jgi:hypothetical protein
MKKWLQIYASDGMSIHASFNDLNEMAIFIRHESEGCLHCEVRLYFSPAAAHVAEAVDAVACKKPIPQDMGLLAGSENAWSQLFPEIAISNSKS